MNSRRLMSYLITIVMLGGALALPATASAHGYRSDGYYSRDYGRRHHPGPKWRKHRGHSRMGREYYDIPRHRLPSRAYITVPGLRLRRDSEPEIIYRRYWE